VLAAPSYTWSFTTQLPQIVSIFPTTMRSWSRPQPDVQVVFSQISIARPRQTALTLSKSGSAPVAAPLLAMPVRADFVSRVQVQQLVRLNDNVVPAQVSLPATGAEPLLLSVKAVCADAQSISWLNTTWTSG